jgi:hypothetical protein
LIPESNSGQTVSKRSLIIALTVVLTLIVVGVGGYTIHSNNVKAEKEAIRAELALKAYQEELEAERIRNDVTWVPDGYYAWTDDKSVAYKWIEGAGNDCYDCRYWTLEVVSKYGCSDGLYGEMNIEKNGIVVSYSNDTLNYLGPYQAGRLSFETYIDGSITGDLTELNCR